MNEGVFDMLGSFGEEYGSMNETQLNESVGEDGIFVADCRLFDPAGGERQI